MTKPLNKAKQNKAVKMIIKMIGQPKANAKKIMSELKKNFPTTCPTERLLLILTAEQKIKR